MALNNKGAAITKGVILNILSLFSGIEGFVKGFEMAGFKFNKHYTSEIDKYANAITRYNYPNAIELGSVTGISGKQLEKINIITFGFPCQDLSLAGNRKGFNGSRSSLFFEALRLIQETKPDLFIFENVKGIFSSNAGKDFVAVLRSIANIGLYECEWQLVNTNYVLPQNRERIYFAGHLRNSPFKKIFPIKEDDQIFNERKDNKPQTQYYSCLTAKSTKAESTYVVYNSQPRTGDPKKGGTGLLKKDDGTVYTIDTANTNVIDDKSRLRRLTPIECERLQGFPDDYTKYGIYDGDEKHGNKGKTSKKIISDTQRYKVLGNAVTTEIVKLIASKLI